MVKASGSGKVPNEKVDTSRRSFQFLISHMPGMRIGKCSL